MYIHLGQDTVVKQTDIVGIFDLDNTTVSAKTREFLATAEQKGQVVTVGYELPKSFVVCAAPGHKNNLVYISQLSGSTLQGRLGFLDAINYRKEDTKV